jgi:ATP-dependent helicase/nuclease subunit A
LLWEGKAEKNSWAEAWPFQTLAGSHQEQEAFTYQVLEGSFDPQISSKAEVLGHIDPGPWRPVEFSMSHETMAVTSMIAGERQVAVQAKPIAAVTLQKALAKAYRGTEAHRIFEALKYTSVESVLSSVEDEELALAIQYIVACNEIPLMQVVRAGHAEWGFSFKQNEFWVQGQIDLWGKVGEEVWLVDYKTGSSAHSETAFEQLKAYAWALHKMKFVGPETPLHLAVIYPFEQKIKTEKNIDVRSLVQKFEM